ncbi:MAG: TIGR03936 family radical SAM-associated protein [Candidatus Omnitrophica bacterium]|nr:TIGR03936 family radical SAM-associated protein [Candidatus Omnitrophota bacterium]MCM8828622.1 TIGR03936 family radical SAM-associated protein [Candidatus Omnitrophota bacterium]
MPVLRIVYQKKLVGRFISANYIGNIFERSMRRLQVDLVFSQGFNRRVRMSFGPPLAVGIAGRNEIVYIYVKNTNMSCQLIKEKLNEILPEGLKVVDCEYFQDNKKPPLIKKAIYLIKISEDKKFFLPQSWKIVSLKDNIMEIEISLEKFKHKELFDIFGPSGVIERFLIF